MNPSQLSGQASIGQHRFAAQAAGGMGVDGAGQSGSLDAAAIAEVLSKYVGPMVDERISDALESRVRQIVDERIQAETERRAWRNDPGVF